VIRAESELGLQWSRNATLRASLRGQWTRDPLIAFERINFGGLSGGQAFDPGALAGDSGVSASLQWLIAPRQVGSWGSIRPWLQLAGARLTTANDGGFAAAEGASASVGLTWSPRGAWQIELVWAEPIGSRGADSAAFGSRFLVRVTGSLERRAADRAVGVP
jgi:hemolysin activation/secretion protein